MGTVARAEPSTVVTSLTNGHTAQVCADSQHDEPLWLLDTIGVLLGITEGRDLDGIGFFDFGRGAVADEDGLTTPLDDDVLALGDGSEVNLDLGHGEDVGGGGHIDEEVCGREGLMLAPHAIYVASMRQVVLWYQISAQSRESDIPSGPPPTPPLSPPHAPQLTKSLSYIPRHTSKGIW